MKVFKDEICYVDYLDLVRYPVPVYFRLDSYIIDKNDMAIVTDLNSVEYIKNRKDILDYNEVSVLSNSDLEKKWEESHNILNRYAKKMLDTPLESQGRLYRDREFMDNYNYYKYRTKDLRDYIDNKELMDNKINSKINSRKGKIMVRKND